MSRTTTQIASLSHSVASPRAIAEAVAGGFHLDPVGSCRFLHFGFNDVYRLECTTGRRYVLRISRADWRSAEDIAWEADALRHLHRHGVSVALPITNRDGDWTTTLAYPEGERLATLFHFVAGAADPLTEDGAEKSYRLGQQLAGIHRALDRFASRHARRELDMDHLLIRPLAYLRRHLSAAQLEVVERAASAAEEMLPGELLRRLDQGFCHGDVHPGNCHWHDGNVTFLDFDLAGRSWRAYELAVFRLNARYVDVEAERWPAFVTGYRELRPLSDPDLEAAFSFVAVRQVYMIHHWHKLRRIKGENTFSDRFLGEQVAHLRRWMHELGG